MENIVYTKELVKTIVEESRLNADPESNRPLYDLIRSTQLVLQHKQPESIPSETLICLEDQLAQHSHSYAARHYRGELLEYEASRIIRARDVFELDRVERLIQNLGEYRTLRAFETRQELSNLWDIVQEARIHATGKTEFEGARVVEVLKALKPYVPLSSEISGVRQKLSNYLCQKDPFYFD
ncbi:MAG: hypothetical protein Q7K45_07520 [Nanoarchaeota archaeon]|nr:hypothetical protein [Nanoarchaeota archaeon]